MSPIRACGDEDFASLLTIINTAAEAYRGVIPPDRWHDPYMPADALRREIVAGVSFWGFETDRELIGVMGMQPVRDVELIRHAYVLPGQQRRGVRAGARHSRDGQRRATGWCASGAAPILSRGFAHSNQ